MIGALRGTLHEKTPEYVIVDVGGVGYQVYLPLPAYYEIGERGDEVQLRIYTHVRDDVLQLYGFKDLPQQRLFEHLIAVAGIGPKLAVTILSGMEVDVLTAAIADGDIARLSTIPGVGKKTAERMALELKDKVEELAPVAYAAVFARTFFRPSKTSGIVPGTPSAPSTRCEIRPKSSNRCSSKRCACWRVSGMRSK